MAKPVALIDDGKISGLAGTTNGDVLTWNNSTQAWESQPGGGAGSSWSLTGNAATTPGTNYVGTSDAQQLQIRTNNLEAIRVDTAQQVGINASGVTLTHAFEVHGSTHLNPTGGSTTDIGNLSNGGDVNIYAHQSNKTVDLQASAVNLQTAGAGTTTIGNTASGGAVALSAADGSSITVGGATTQTINLGTLGTGAVTISNSGAATTVAGSSVTVTSAAANINTTGSGTTTIGNQTSGGNVSITGAVSSALSMSPGSMTVTLRTQTVNGTAGGALTMISGAGSTTGAGGALVLTSGAGGTSGNGGNVTISGGNAGNAGAGGVAGTFTVAAGYGTSATPGTGTGTLSIRGGWNLSTSVRSGDVTILGGYDPTGNTVDITPGNITVGGGDTSFASNTKTAGSATFRGGDNTSTIGPSAAGAATFRGGNGRVGGATTLQGGNGTTTNGALTIKAGDGAGTAANVTMVGGKQASIINVGGNVTDYVSIGQNEDVYDGTSYNGVPTFINGFLGLTVSTESLTGATNTLQIKSSFIQLAPTNASTITTFRTTGFTAGAICILKNGASFSVSIPLTVVGALTAGARTLQANATMAFVFDGTNWCELCVVGTNA